MHDVGRYHESQKESPVVEDGVAFTDAVTMSDFAKGVHRAMVVPEVRTFYRFAFAGNRELPASSAEDQDPTPALESRSLEKAWQQVGDPDG